MGYPVSRLGSPSITIIASRSLPSSPTILSAKSITKPSSISISLSYISTSSAMSGSPSTIRVAILGGGLAGAALLRGLLRYHHIAVDIYESRPTFQEEALGLSLTDDAQDILHALDPALDQCLDRAGAVHSLLDIRIATGPNVGQRVLVAGLEGHVKKTLGRQALLDELLKGMPPQIMHLNARIASITELTAGEGLLVTFADGSQKKYDVVIGASGFNGLARKHVLGADNPAVKLHHTGVWGLPITVPLDKAQEAMGTEFLDPGNPTQTAWIADGILMQHNLLNHGRDVQISIYVRYYDCGEDAPWARLFSPDEFSGIFADIHSPVCQGMVKLIQSIYTVQIAGICQMQHQPTPQSYVTKNACLIGDSAYAMMVHQGAGAIIALEEALVLSTLLGRASSREAIPAALQAFDRTCRPRAEHAAQYSAHLGLVFTGRHPSVGPDAGLIAQELQRRWVFLAQTDVEAQRAAAVGLMDQLLAGGRCY
ncbi:Uu.00g108140.m01.CDS01 [Anthostomella pinea]|uniref:Uu.00g108140.m01.CDS01 n=1 Tax=Anthostomella pinea TaxID=933095 RepID=A0AAI8YG67_9PEZI|nr:Uu.00g108140.m01.CDS01 [Anthostomella pinea]